MDMPSSMGSLAGWMDFNFLVGHPYFYTVSGVGKRLFDLR
jgi:hypothetical protein